MRTISERLAIDSDRAYKQAAKREVFRSERRLRWSKRPTIRDGKVVSSVHSQARRSSASRNIFSLSRVVASHRVHGLRFAIRRHRPSSSACDNFRRTTGVVSTRVHSQVDDEDVRDLTCPAWSLTTIKFRSIPQIQKPIQEEKEKGTSLRYTNRGR